MFPVQKAFDIALPDLDELREKNLPPVLARLGYKNLQGTDLAGRAKRGGSRFPLNPNRLRHTIKWELDRSKAVLHLTLTAAALPWMRRRVWLLLQEHAKQVETQLTDRDREADSGRAFQIIPSVSEGGWALAMGSVLASVLLGTLFAALVNLVFGYGIIGETLDYLRAKATLLEPFAPLSLPSVARLDSLSSSFLWGCSFFFALTIGILSGLTGSLLLLVGEVCPPLSRICVWTVVTASLALGAYTYRAQALYLNIACTLALPLSLLFGYSLGWGRRRAPQRTRPWFLRGAVILFLALLALQAGMKTQQPGGGLGSEDMVKDFLEFRDRKLLNTGAGRRLSEFYYSHTLYPAEVIKPLSKKAENSILLFSDSHRTCQVLSGLMANPKVHVLCVDDSDDFLSRFQAGGADYLLLDADAAGTEDILADSQAGSLPPLTLGPTILLGQPERIEELRNHPGLPPLTEFITAPVDSSKLNQALDSLSNKGDRNRHLRQLVKVSLLAVLACLWALTISSRMLLVAGPVLLVYLAGARVWKRAWPAPRWILLASGLILSLWLGARSYLYQPLIAEEIQEIRNMSSRHSLAREQLCEYLVHENPKVRYEAVYGLWRLPPQKKGVLCTKALTTGLEDPDQRVRIWCAMNLGRQGGDQGAREALARALEDPVINVRCKAALALGQIGDRDSLRHVEARMEQGDTWYVLQHLANARLRLLQRLGHRHPSRLY